MENILGDKLPVELQRKISLYMESSTAMLIKNFMKCNIGDILMMIREIDIAVSRNYITNFDNDFYDNCFRKMLENQMKKENLVKRDLKTFNELTGKLIKLRYKVE